MTQIFTPIDGVQELKSGLKAITAIPGWQDQQLESGNLSDGVRAYKASAWAMRAIQVRADAVAQAPIKLYDSDDQEIEQHPLLDLLAYVNDELNPQDLWRYTESATCVYGPAYWEKVRVGSKVKSLFLLNPGTMKVNATRDGIQSFEQSVNGNKRVFPREDVVYFRGVYDPMSDLTGMSPLRFAMAAALGDNSADKYISAFFSNGAVPAVIFTTPQTLVDTTITNLLSWWNKLFKGPDNAHKIGFVGNDLKPIVIGTNPKDLALADVRRELHRSISTALGVPELLITAADAADQTPTEMAFRIFYQTTIAPRWQWYADILNAELLTEFPDLVRSGAVLKFDTSKIPAMVEDTDAQAKRLSMLVDSGIIKPVTAAIELGYSEEDVPEEAPAPAPLNPPVGKPAPAEDYTQGNEGQSTGQVRDGNEITPPSSEQMKDWRAAALMAVGEAVGCPFDAELLTCKTRGDVRQVFERHRPRPQTDELKRSNDLLERALAVLEAGR